MKKNRLPFLESAKHLENKGGLNIEGYWKPTHKDQCLLFTSHQPLEHNLGVIRTLHHWANNVPIKTEGKTHEHKHITAPKPVDTLTGNMSNPLSTEEQNAGNAGRGEEQTLLHC